MGSQWISGLQQSVRLDKKVRKAMSDLWESGFLVMRPECSPLAVILLDLIYMIDLETNSVGAASPPVRV